MMYIKKHIPNLITLGNLFCGTVAVIFAVKNQLEMAALFVVLGVLFDFLDGFVARLLHVSGELGKQLDSLADMVTSGVVPGIVMYQLLMNATTPIEDFSRTDTPHYLAYIGLLLTLGAGYRLAKFNIDTRQTDAFIGLPTPAMALFVLSIPLIQLYEPQPFFLSMSYNPYFLIGVTVLFVYLMNAEIKLFALKFKTFGWKENALKYLFLLTCIILLITLRFVAIPLIILLYVLISFMTQFTKAASS